MKERKGEKDYIMNFFSHVIMYNEKERKEQKILRRMIGLIQIIIFLKWKIISYLWQHLFDFFCFVLFSILRERERSVLLFFNAISLKGIIPIYLSIYLVIVLVLNDFFCKKIFFCFLLLLVSLFFFFCSLKALLEGICILFPNTRLSFHWIMRGVYSHARIMNTTFFFVKNFFSFFLIFLIFWFFVWEVYSVRYFSSDSWR